MATPSAIVSDWIARECDERGLRLILHPIAQRAHYMQHVAVEFCAVYKPRIVVGGPPDAILRLAPPPVNTTTLNLFVEDMGLHSDFLTVAFAYT